MQLSASTLPFDPTPLPTDSNSCALGASEKEGRNSAGSDFGAMLSAHNGRERSDVKTRSSCAKTPSHPAPKPKILSRADEQAETARELNSRRSERSLHSETEIDPAHDPVVVATVDAAAPPTDAAALTISWLAGEGSVDTNTAEVTDASEVTSEIGITGESDSNRALCGQPFLGATMTGKTPASLRAYGFRPDGLPNVAVPGEQGQGAIHAASPALLHARADAFASALVPSPATPEGTGQSSDVGGSSGDLATLGSDILLNGAPSSQPISDVSADSIAKPDPTGPLSLTSESLETLPAPEVSPTAETELGTTTSQASVIETSIRMDENPINGVAPELGREKFAVRASRLGERAKSVESGVEISSLEAGEQRVKASYGRIGINAAKPETLMSAPASTPTPATVTMDASKLEAMPLSFDGLTRGATEKLSSQIEQTANRAVESALAVAEQFVPGEQRSVRLQFNVGGEDLAVRVELRGEKVHTTFRAESPELCSALAREWQAVSAVQGSERMHRLAEPVFSSSSSGQSFSSDSGSAQRDAGSRNPHAAPQEFVDLRRALRGQSNAPAPAAVAAPVLPIVASSSGRLHTFA